MIKTKDLIDQKWDAIDSASKTMNAVRSDLFDNVALALARIEGRLKFLNGESYDNEPFILEGHAQKVGVELEQEVNKTRKELDKIFVMISDGKDSLFTINK
jgi:hypothetical protein|tara:strand:- start:6272 stop:6574 length:303 start_codon:yes stop_codon:yes gene_type:complete